VKAIRVLAILILLAGTCLTGRAAYLHAKAKLASVLIRRAWEQSLRSGRPHAPWSWADTRAGKPTRGRPSHELVPVS
jgi:sortase A